MRIELLHSTISGKKTVYPYCQFVLKIENPIAIYILHSEIPNILGRKALTATGWGKQKETLMATYKAVMRPALEYASSVWSPIASSTSINKLQVMQNAALRTATGCTQDTNIQHLHDETLSLPIHEHLQLHASQYKQKTQHPSHPLHKHTTYFNTPRLKKTLFLKTAATQQTFPQTPTQSLQQT